MAGSKMKLIVMGCGDHGKDTACEYFSTIFGLTFISSSWAACDLVVYPALKEELGYETVEQCFADRRNQRAKFYETIKAYNTPDKTRLARQVFELVDIYCGMRCVEEFEAAKTQGLFDYAIWVDASKRRPPESDASCTVTPDLADIVINNNGTTDELFFEVFRAMQELNLMKNKAVLMRRSAAGKKRKVA
jgi:hypothetical protein